MSEKSRNLPLWMVKSAIRCNKDKDAEKKKSHETTERMAKKRRSVVMYWMNERELVETALSILKDDKSRAGGAEEVMIVPETDEDTSDSDGQDRTCVSNIAEQETVPYGHCVEENSGAKLHCHLKPSDTPGTDDEALQLVREIFFTRLKS